MNILIVAAHPDDEVLGVGSSIARWVRDGHSVSVMFFTDGVGARGPDGASARSRRAAAKKAADVLGFKIVAFGAMPDNQLDTVPLLKLAQSIERIKRKLNPDVVYTHFWGDLNIDHRRSCEAVLTAFRPQPDEICSSVYSFEVASATEWGSPGFQFRPTTYTEVSGNDVERAVRAYQAYEREVRPDPHSRSVQAFISRRIVRGREIGVEWAEGTMLCRELRRV